MEPLLQVWFHISFGLRNTINLKFSSFLLLIKGQYFGHLMSCNGLFVHCLWVRFSMDAWKEKIEDGWAAHTGAEVQIFSEPLFSSFSVQSKSFWLYNIPDLHANSRGHTSASSWSHLPPRHCTGTCLFPPCHPRNLCNGSEENPCSLFTLDTRYISCYFSAGSDFHSCIDKYQKNRVNIQQYMYLVTPPHVQDVIQGQFFLSRVFKFFLLLGRLLYQC